MDIRKAVITAAGRGLRLYPAADTVQKAMFPVVDRDGVSKPVLQIIAEEAFDSGIEEICIVCAPGDEARYQEQFGALRANLLETFAGVDWAQDQARRIDTLLGRSTFVAQESPKGYGDAVSAAKTFTGSDPFLLLLGDHLYISANERRCATQLLATAKQHGCAVSAVHATREHLVGRYGTLSGARVAQSEGLYEIEKIIEKPSLSRAEVELQTPGLRVGQYLCFFGMHVLTPTIFALLDKRVGEGDHQLTPSLQELARQERYLALEIQGRRFDIGGKFGLLQAQMAFALAGAAKDEAAAHLMELLTEELIGGGER